MISDGIKIAVRAFFYAERNMDIYAGMAVIRFQVARFKFQVTKIKLKDSIGNRQ